MTDLEAITENPTPRPERLAQRFARRIEPTWGFVLYGILYWMFVANMVGTLPLIAAVAYYQSGEAPGWVMFLSTIWYPLIQVPLWWLFQRWKAGRRADAVRLVRDGEIVTASVTRSTGMDAARQYTIAFQGIVLRPAVDLGDEPQCKVLYRSNARHCFVFAPDGSAVACGIGRGDPLGPLGRESNVDPLPEARIVE